MRKLIFLIACLTPAILVNGISVEDPAPLKQNQPAAQATAQAPTGSITVTIIPKNTADNPSIASARTKPFINQNSVYGKPYPFIKYGNNGALPPSSPTYQTNFQPVQHHHHHQGDGNSADPIIMQYLPQTQLNNGIQYLQLIPTRPLLVPISSFIPQAANGNFQLASNPLQVGRHFHNSNPPQQPQPQSQSQPQPQNEQAQAAATNSHPLYTPGSFIGGYASNVPNFRLFKPNKGIEILDGPQDLSLNTNEYIPTADEVKALATMVVKGRP